MKEVAEVLLWVAPLRTCFNVPSQQLSEMAGAALCWSVHSEQTDQLLLHQEQLGPVHAGKEGYTEDVLVLCRRNSHQHY